jgi:hypothetical protein
MTTVSTHILDVTAGRPRFHGFPVDRGTTPARTDDGVLATAVAAHRRMAAAKAGRAGSFRGAQGARW